MPFERVTFLNAGHCAQLGYLAGRDRLGIGQFHAVFAVLEHARHGVSLIDTGYGPGFLSATEPLPERLYRWATPVTLAAGEDARGILTDHGQDANQVKRVFISHFHGDHIGGISCFPDARFIHRAKALKGLLALPRWRQVSHGFLRALLPKDFDSRAMDVPESAYLAGQGALEGFMVHDFWGDGDLLMVDLPGHAPGHTGYVIRTHTQIFFYIVDACWDMSAMTRGWRMPFISKRTLQDFKRYVETQERLRRLTLKTDWQFLACHCPRTQEHVATNTR